MSAASPTIESVDAGCGERSSYVTRVSGNSAASSSSGTSAATATRRGRRAISPAAAAQKRLGCSARSPRGQKKRSPPAAISAGDRVRPATSVTSTATAMAGPVVLNSDTLAGSMARPPTTTVAAEQEIASPTRRTLAASDCGAVPPLAISSRKRLITKMQ